jgi:hypothetical protein
MVSRSVHRFVRNQILFREVNERIRETIGSAGTTAEFLCECSNEDCIESLVLDLSEYERIRSDANLFVIVPGHERLEVDRVIDQGRGYVLVEKTAEVQKVIATDPRSPEGRSDGPSGANA